MVREMLEVAMGEFGRVDSLVNNAGVSFIAPAEETTLSDWRRVLEVNLTGPFPMSRIFGVEMLRRGSGSIVNVSSVAGLLGIGDRAEREQAWAYRPHEYPSRRVGRKGHAR